MKFHPPDANHNAQNAGSDSDHERHSKRAEDASTALHLAAFDAPPRSGASARSEEARLLAEADRRSNLSDGEKRTQVGALAGNPAETRIGGQMELNAVLHALKRDPTPEGLGKEGCMASISRYAIEPALRQNGINIPHFIDSHQFLAYIQKHPELAQIQTRSQRDLRVSDLQPGDVIIGQKSTGNHVMMVTRVPANWQYPGDALMLTGNTGLKMPDGPNYPHFRAAQEVIGPGTDRYNYHHGQLNSQVPTNPYLGGRFQIIRFRDRQ